MATNQVKQIWLTSIFILYSAGLFWAVAAAVQRGDYSILIVPLVIAGIIWVAALSILLGLMDMYPKVAIYIALPILLIIFSKFHLVSLIVTPILILSLLASNEIIEARLGNQIKYTTLHGFYNGTKLIIFTLLIVVTALILPTIEESVTNLKIEIPEATVNFITKPFGPLLTTNFPTNSTSFILNDLFPNTLNQQETDLINSLNTNQEAVNPITMITKTINQQIDQIIAQYPFIATILAILLVAIAIRIIIPIALWPSLGAIALFVMLLRKAKLVTMFEQEKLAQELRLL